MSQIRTLKDTFMAQEEKENPIKETDKEWSEKEGKKIPQKPRGKTFQ